MRFKLLLAFALSALLIFSTLNRPTQAAVPLLAPAAAVATLEVLIIAVAAAAAIGVITVQQNEQYQAQLNSLINDIKEKTGEALEASLRQAAVLLTLTRGDLSPVGAANAMASYATSAATCRTGSCNSSTVRETNGGACSGNIQECCGDFLNKFRTRVTRSGFAVKVFNTLRKRRWACCMEWDHRHSAFEVFDKQGRHLGERSCEDLWDNPCAPTPSRGRHAEANSSTHQPRSGLCRR